MDVEGMRKIEFLRRKRRSLYGYLETYAVISTDLRDSFVPVWNKHLLPFLERYFFSSFSQKKSPVLNSFRWVEQECNTHLRRIIRKGEMAKIGHIRFYSCESTFKKLGIYASKGMFDAIYNGVHSSIPYVELFLPMTHLSYLLIVPEKYYNEDKFKLSRKLEEIEKKFLVRYIMYEKNIYEDSVDMARLHRDLRL